ncbi:hypothetical protein Glove_38g38 [Diversispora epigaea]|uniref:Eisosome component PIL1-domain-containing protein n=1 Tax=Diversispora epigaea TaxID=1348612 RepID=A0A397JKE0_9GLOM|nr:hypothetical protein Glove_38g38 [Diversispora epigaea]
MITHIVRKNKLIPLCTLKINILSNNLQFAYILYKFKNLFQFFVTFTIFHPSHIYYFKHLYHIIQNSLSLDMKLFKLGDITSDIRHNLATNPLVNNDTKHLSKLISTERSVWNSLNSWANDQGDSSKCLAVWGRSEDNDLCDVTEKVGILTAKLAKLGTNLAIQYERYRTGLKEIRNEEEKMREQRTKKEALWSKIEREERKSKRTDTIEQKLKDLRKELEIMEKDTIEEETQLADFKRKKLRSALMIQFDAWYEFGQKLVILAGSSKEIVDQIPIDYTKPGDSRAPYHGKELTEQIVINATKSLDEWTTSQKLLTYQPSIQEDFQTTHSRTNSQISDLQPDPRIYSQHSRTNSQTSDLQSSPQIHSQRSRTFSQTSSLQTDPQTTNIQTDSQTTYSNSQSSSVISLNTLSPPANPNPPQNTPIVENSEFSFEQKHLPYVLPVLPELPTDKFSNYFEDSPNSTEINHNNNDDDDDDDNFLNQSTTESFREIKDMKNISDISVTAVVAAATAAATLSIRSEKNNTSSPPSVVGTSLEVQIFPPPDQRKDDQKIPNPIDPINSIQSDPLSRQLPSLPQPTTVTTTTTETVSQEDIPISDIPNQDNQSYSPSTPTVTTIDTTTADTTDPTLKKHVHFNDIEVEIP